MFPTMPTPFYIPSDRSFYEGIDMVKTVVKDNMTEMIRWNGTAEGPLEISTVVQARYNELLNTTAMRVEERRTNAEVILPR